MHATNPHQFTPATAATPAHRDEVEQNGTFRNTPTQNPLPSLTPAAPAEPPPTPLAVSRTNTPPNLPSPGIAIPGSAPSSPATLTPRQLTAISLLCSGMNLQLTAAKLGIGRTTLHRWRTTHPAFRAELARRQHDLHDTASRRLRLTLLRAVGTITTEIRTGYYQKDRVKAALALLRHADLPALLAPPASLTTDHCLDDLIRADRASRNLDPTLEITDADRDDHLAQLQEQDLPDPPPVPTHQRLRYGLPYPTPDNAPPQDPEFEI